MQSIKPEQQNSVDDINQILNQDENLAQVLKLMVKGVSFEGLSDIEILNTLNSFSTSITYQINDALEELLVNNMVKHLHNISNTIDTFKSIQGIDEKIKNIANNNI